jgi:hypothetical protein
VALTALACNGVGERLSLEEYFQRVEEVGTSAQSAYGRETVAPLADDATEEDAARFARETIMRSVSVLGEARDSLDGLNPPSEVEKAHDRFVEALGKEVSATKAVADRLPDALSVFELQGLEKQFDTPELNDAYAQEKETCKELQAVADENEIDVDLQCE